MVENSNLLHHTWFTLLLHVKDCFKCFSVQNVRVRHIFKRLQNLQINARLIMYAGGVMEL